MSRAASAGTARTSSGGGMGGKDGDNSSLDYRTLTLLNRLASERRALLSRTERLYGGKEGSTNASGNGSGKGGRPPSAATGKLTRLNGSSRSVGGKPSGRGEGSNGGTGFNISGITGAAGGNRPGSARPADRGTMRPGSASGPKQFSQFMDRRPQTAAGTAGIGKAGIDLQGKSLSIASRRLSRDSSGSTGALPAFTSKGSGSGGGPGTGKAGVGSARGSGHGGGGSGPYPVGPLVITESDVPGVPLVYRSDADRDSNPERLNLDRRKLATCPIVEGEEMLRLLNFQNNSISQISNMEYIPNLIFLDLYNNQITELCNLEPLVSLRVLMLGKNKISRIENLACLPMLDVLDLHSNRISVIENLESLTELRVLNLAGNMISTVENLSRLACLTELNLRRNKIEAVKSIEDLDSLQRLFLSNNQIKTFSAVQSLFECTSLTELALDGNPVASGGFYRQYVLEHIKSLRHLDLKRITDEERKISAILGQQDIDDASMRADRAGEKGARESTIDAVQQAMVDDLSSADPGTLYAVSSTQNGNGSNSARRPGANESNSNGNGGTGDSPMARRVRTARAAPGETGDRGGEVGGTRNIRPASAGRIRPQSLHDSGTSSGAVSGGKIIAAKNGAEEAEAKFFRGNKGFMELDQSDGRLCIYGNSIEGLERYSNVDRVLIKFMSFPKLLVVIPKLKKFSRLSSLTLSNNNIETIAQLSHLGMLTHLRDLEVVSNPVIECAHFRLYCIFRLSSLRVLNGIPVTGDEQRRANDLFVSLHRLGMNRVASVDPSCLPVMNKQITDFMYDQYAQRTAASTVSTVGKDAPSTYISSVIKDSVGTHTALMSLHQAWSKALEGHIRETLRTFEGNFGTAMRDRLKKL